MSTTVAYDGISANVSTLPAGQHAGYTTGSSIIEWTAAQWAADPGAIRICQDPSASDHTADVLDVESGAATVEDIVSWVEQARAAYTAGTRPGQREPIVYVNGSELTPAANALAAAGLTGVGLWLAQPGTPAATAVAEVNAGSGPYPVKGVQYAWGGTYDVDVFSTSWLTTQSGKAGDTISEGNSGPAVKAAQTDLNAAGVKVTVDGLFGPDTKAAVEAFQEAKKLTVDGVVGPQTWSALTPKPAPVQYTYPAPTNLQAHGGATDSFASTWDAPDHAGEPAPEYLVYVYDITSGESPRLQNLVASYPRETSATHYNGGSLTKGHKYALHVVAGTGKTARPYTYASAEFTVG